MNLFFLGLQQFLAVRRVLVIRLFQGVYLLIWIAVLGFGFGIFSQSVDFVLVQKVGRKFGELAVLSFLVVTTPGILGRFLVKHPLISIGILFRRYVGILVAFLAIAHALLLFYLPVLAPPTSLSQMTFAFLHIEPFIVFGTTANILLLPLLFTSNNYSVKKLGKWWKRLHRLVYIIFWCIFGHLALQGSTTWGGLIGVFGVLEIASLFFSYRNAQVMSLSQKEVV